MASPKAKLLKQMLDAPLERGLELGKRVGQSLSKDLLYAGLEDSVAQLGGTLGQEHHSKSKSSQGENSHSSAESSSHPPMSGDLAPGQEVNFKGVGGHSEKKTVHKEAGNNYHGEMARSSERSIQRQQSEKDQQIAQLQNELDHLITTGSQETQDKHGVKTVSQTIHGGGTYHVGLLQSYIQSIHTKSADTGAWTSVMSSKNSKKGGGDAFGCSAKRKYCILPIIRKNCFKLSSLTHPKISATIFFVSWYW